MDLYEHALQALAREVGGRVEQTDYDRLYQARATPEDAWALTMTCSSQTRARSVFDKIVNGFQRLVQPLNHFTTVIDTVVQANAIASLTWGPIKFVLIVAKDVHENSVLVVEKLEWIADQLSTIDTFSDILLSSDPDNRLWSPCTKITVDIFVFCILARKFLEVGVFSRIFEAGSTKESILKCVNTIREQLQIVTTLTTALTHGLLRNVDNNLLNLGATMLSSVVHRPDEKHRNVPGLLSLRYTGREAEARWIEETLDKCEATLGRRRAAIFGMTGTGKSQVMLHWDYTHRQTYDHALWITAGSQQKLLDSIQRVLDILDLPARLRPETHVKLDAIRRWLQKTNKWLLMFDNVSDEEHYTIADILPTTSNGDVLFTSQRPGAMEKLAGGFAFCRDLQLLDEATAAELFLKGLQSCRAIAGVEQTVLDDYVKQIVKTVAYLPHAIDGTAAYLKATDIDFPTFMGRLKTDTGRHKIYNYEDQYAQDPERTSVARPFYLSLRDIEKKYPPVTDVLRLFSLFEPERIPPLQLRDWLRDDKASLEHHKRNKGTRPSFFRKLFRKSVCAPVSSSTTQIPSKFQKSNVEAALSKLVEYSLIRKIPEQHGAIWMHDLTRHHARSEIPVEDMPSWLTQAVEVLYHTFPLQNSTPEERQIVDLFLPQAEYIIAQCRTYKVPTENYAKLLAICGICHHIHGAFNSAVISYESARPTFETFLGKSHSQTVTLRHRIGWSKRELGDLKSCEQYHMETYKVRVKQLGPQHELTLDAMSDLAFTIERSGRLEQGEILFKKCYEAEKIARGSRHIRTLCCAHNLALCYANQGRLDEAVSMYELVLNNSKNVDANNHGRLKTLSCLAVAVDHQGYLDKAAELNKEALEGYETKFGKDHLLTLRVRCNLSGLCRTQGKYAEAEALIKDARPVYERVLGTDHFHVAIAEYDIGEVLHEAGRFEEGRQHYSLSLAIMEADDPSPTHPLYMRTVDALGILHRESGELELAQTRSLAAYDKDMKLLGFKDPYTLVAANNYAETLQATGDSAKAKELYEKVLKTEQDLLDHNSGSSHPHTLMTMNDLGRIAWEARNDTSLAHAGKTFESVIEGLKSRLGDTHGCLWIAQANLARTYLLQGHLDKALTLALELRPKFETFFGLDHPMLATVDYLLGTCYFAQDDFVAAKQYFTKSRTLWEKAFGYAGLCQPDLFRAVAMLALTERALNHNTEAEELEAELEATMSISVTSSLKCYWGALWYADLSAIGDVSRDWRTVAPLAYGGTLRMRWGRKTCWREPTETTLVV